MKLGLANQADRISMDMTWLDAFLPRRWIWGTEVMGVKFSLASWMDRSSWMDLGSGTSLHEGHYVLYVDEFKTLRFFLVDWVC